MECICNEKILTRNGICGRKECEHAWVHVVTENVDWYCPKHPKMICGIPSRLCQLCIDDGYTLLSGHGGCDQLSKDGKLVWEEY